MNNLMKMLDDESKTKNLDKKDKNLNIRDVHFEKLLN